MASQSNGLTISVKVIFTALLFSVLMFGVAQNRVEASCMGNISDCYSECREGYEFNTGDCLMIASKTVDSREVTLSELKTECEDAQGDYTAEALGGYNILITCAFRGGPDSMWEVTPVKKCSCILETEEPTTGDVAKAAHDIGLEDISISGIFAGELSINQLVQFVILTVMSILMLVLLFLIIKSGIAYAGSGEDEQKKKGAVKGITNALIGAAIVFGSYLILSLFFSFFGLSPFKKLIPVECEGLEGEALDRCETLVNED